MSDQSDFYEGLSGPGGAPLPEDGGVAILLSGERRGLFWPVALKRASGAAQEVAADIQHHAIHLAAVRRELDDLLVIGREEGLSWASLGWCLGTTADGARKRLGQVIRERTLEDVGRGL